MDGGPGVAGPAGNDSRPRDEFPATWNSERQGIAVWTWPDAIVAAVLGVCLTGVLVLLAGRSGGDPRRGGVAAPAALVVALAATLLTRGETAVRVVVVIVSVAAVVIAARCRRRPGRNEIAPPDPRC